VESETTGIHEIGGITMARSHLLKALKPARVTGRHGHGGRHGHSDDSANTNTNTNAGTGTQTRTHG
jgi:hypothetical protein